MGDFVSHTEEAPTYFHAFLCFFPTSFAHFFIEFQRQHTGHAPRPHEYLYHASFIFYTAQPLSNALARDMMFIYSVRRSLMKEVSGSRISFHVRLISAALLATYFRLDSRYC